MIITERNNDNGKKLSRLIMSTCVPRLDNKKWRVVSKIAEKYKEITQIKRLLRLPRKPVVLVV